MRNAFLILTLVLLVGCTSQSQEEYRFPDFVADIEALDANFQTAYHDEALNVQMIPYNNTTPYITELFSLRSKSYILNSKDSQVIGFFLNARLEMIKSQKLLYEANSLIKDNYTCSDVSQIQEAIVKFVQSRTAASNALDYLDETLSTTYGLLIGVDESRPKWYFSDFDYLTDQIDSSKVFVRDECGIGFAS